MAGHVGGKGKRYEVRQDVVGNTYILWSFDDREDAQFILDENKGKGYYLWDTNKDSKMSKLARDQVEATDDAMLLEIEKVYADYWSKTAKALNKTSIPMGLQNQLLINLENAHERLIDQLES